MPRLRAGLRHLPPAGGGSSPAGSPEAGQDSSGTGEEAKPPAADLSGSATFGWSLYLYNATFWVMTISDRYLIAHFWSSREVGLYAINYGFCAMPYLMLNGWIETFTRSRLYGRAAAGDREGVRAIMKGRLLLAVGGSLAGTAALWFLAEPIGLLLLGTTYWQGLRLAMILCAAYALYVMGNVFHSLFIAMKRAEVLARTALLAAATNVSLNLILVPRHGIEGAAWSALASFGLWFVVLWASAWRLTLGLPVERP